MQIPGFNDSFPEKEEEKEDDQHDQGALHHVG